MARRENGPLGTLYALKTGVVPPGGIAEITVGRTGALRRIRDALEFVDASGQSQLDFIEGDYGEGKSHLLDLAREESLSRQFGVSKFAANFDASPLHRPKLVLRAITRGLELPGREGVGLESLLRNLVETSDFSERAEHLYDQWSDPRLRWRRESLSVWPPALYAASVRPDLVEPIARWLGGEDILIRPVREKIAEVCDTPKKMAVTAYDLPTIILGLANSLTVLGHRGLVVVIDELENALSHAATINQRRIGVTLLSTLGTARGALYVLGAVTPSVVTALRVDSTDGWGLHPGWKDQFKFVLGKLNGAAPLRVRELAHKDMLKLGTRVLRLHETAFGWDADARFGPGMLTEFVVNHAVDHDYPVRGLVRTLVQMLDLCEQYPWMRLTAGQQG